MLVSVLAEYGRPRLLGWAALVWRKSSTSFTVSSASFFPPSLVFRTCTKSKVLGRAAAGGMTTMSSVISTTSEVDEGRRHQRDGPADPGQAGGSTAGDSG